MGTKGIESCNRMHFENRKRRPQERGKKKRKKEKRSPLGLIWNSSGTLKTAALDIFPIEIEVIQAHILNS
jgi:hypothetical protein